MPLLQGRLLGRLGRDLRGRLRGLKTDAQRCLQFARSVLGTATAVCGMKDIEHVEENLKVVSIPPLSGEEMRDMPVLGQER